MASASNYYYSSKERASAARQGLTELLDVSVKEELLNPAQASPVDDRESLDSQDAPLRLFNADGAATKQTLGSTRASLPSSKIHDDLSTTAGERKTISLIKERLSSSATKKQYLGPKLSHCQSMVNLHDTVEYDLGGYLPNDSPRPMKDM